MSRFLTERKPPKENANSENVLTPRKTSLCKPVLVTDTPTDPPAPDSDPANVAQTPVSKLIHQNIHSAQGICQEIFSNIDKLQALFAEAQQRIENEPIDFGDAFDSPKAGRKRDPGTTFKLSELKCDTNKKIRSQASYFAGLQKIRALAQRYLQVQHFTTLQMKCLEKFLFDDRAIVNANANSGKSSVAMLYLKMLVDECPKDTPERFFLLPGKARVDKLAGMLAGFELKDRVTFMTQDINRYTELLKAETEPKTLIVDGLDLTLENIMNLRVICSSFFAGGRVIYLGFNEPGKISMFRKLMKWAQCECISGVGFSTMCPQGARVRVSFEEAPPKAAMKLILEKIDKKRGMKLQYPMDNFIPFCVVTKNAAFSAQIADLASGANVKMAPVVKKGGENVATGQYDFFVARSLTEIPYQYRYLIVLDFRWEATYLAEILARAEKSVYLIVDPRTYHDRRNALLKTLIDVSRVKELTEGFDHTSYLKTVWLDGDTARGQFEQTSSFLLYLQKKAFAEVNGLKKHAKFQISYKNEREFRSKLSREMQDYMASVGAGLVKMELVLEDKPGLPENLREEIAGYRALDGVTVTELKTFELKLSTTYRRLKQFPEKIGVFMSEFNEEMLGKMRTVDALYTALKKNSLFSAGKDKGDGACGTEALKTAAERILLSQAGLGTGPEAVPEPELLPFKENYKKLDVVRDFSQAINDNFKLVSSRYFSLKQVEVDLILKSVVLDVIKQALTGAVMGFDLSAGFEQKLRTMNVVSTYKTMMGSLEFLKKNVFK